MHSDRISHHFAASACSKPTGQVLCEIEASSLCARIARSLFKIEVAGNGQEKQFHAVHRAYRRSSSRSQG